MTHWDKQTEGGGGEKYSEREREGNEAKLEAVVEMGIKQKLKTGEESMKRN